MEIRRPDVEGELQYLKDFQRLSVETVFRRMYLDPQPTLRFLIADEVGLGKTLVARGVIARTIDHLWEKVERIDIVYLCSNAGIARQNIRRLTPRDIDEVSMASRITLLPIEKTRPGDDSGVSRDFQHRRVNIIALTPDTSLNLKGNLGLKRERALLLHILASHWKLDFTGACRLFAGNASLQPFKRLVKNFGEKEEVDAALAMAFTNALDAECSEAMNRSEKTIRDRLERLIADHRNNELSPRELAAPRTAIVGELRHILARSCIRALQPDLIILDEFQRFKELLDGKGPAAEMAKELFDYKDSFTETRVLLLSATPYKMYTVQDDAEGEDHYVDFLRTARFLFRDDPAASDRLGELLQQFRHELFRLGQDGEGRLVDIRNEIEECLRKVMVRTERLAVTPDRNGMLLEVAPGNISVQARDAHAYVQMQAIGRLVNSSDTIEYWKAAPWLLNFMDDQYKLRTDLNALIEDNPSARPLVKAMSAAASGLLSSPDTAAFKRLDPAHGRMRWLMENAFDGNLWKLLWLPPTLPYYELDDPFHEAAKLSPTKSLLFSAWRVVPRVVAAILSHEAERRMYVALEGLNTDLRDAPERLGDLLQISRKRKRVAGLTVLTLIYPSTWLARTCNPMAISAEFAAAHSRPPTMDELLDRIEQRILPALERILPNKPVRLAPDESWYWAAPILLDRANDGMTDEWTARELAGLWAGLDGMTSTESLREEDADDSEENLEDDETSPAIYDLVEQVRQTAMGAVPQGTPPKDLLRVLALAALGGPATLALRSFERVTGVSALKSLSMRDHAAKVGASFRTLFNQPDSTAVVRAARGNERQDYWKECLEYSCRGCLQSVLDEYSHLLIGEAGVIGKSSDETLAAIAGSMTSAIGLRRARVGAYDIVVERGRVKTKSTTFRSRYAMRFGEERADEKGDTVRADDVRRAFNSPFWPFVLATTSVGQEGLDFHLYCHRVIHWNLPPNPVDLEQREGRVHRFKGHAVRKNVAITHPIVWLSSREGDPWEDMFAEAMRKRPPEENDLVPFWIYAAPNGAKIERYVPSYPLSREVGRFESLKNSLAVYRMVFGQPRQEELLSYLKRVVPAERIPLLIEQLKISLAPRP